MSSPDPRNPLPYTDTKPVGAADFYFVINATFRFVLQKFGTEGLRRYWSELGSHYFAPVSEKWKQSGLPAVAAYWKAFFAAEPQAEVRVQLDGSSVLLDVKVCPAIHHLRKHGREIVPCFCQHCYFVSDAMARSAGFTARVEGGNGSCCQTFQPASEAIAPQDLSLIREATC
jgi:hypothetical protein